MVKQSPNERKQKIKERTHRWRQALRAEILSYYGHGKLACIKCGFNDIRALSIDHIEGGGKQHRKRLSRNSYVFYYWLKQEGFPEGYQTLCLNCQRIKQTEGKEQANQYSIREET